MRQTLMITEQFEDRLGFAQSLDQADVLAGFRDQFWFPRDANGHQQLYLCGNSLGLQPKALAPAIARELEDWQRLGVEGHFKAEYPWMPYHQFVREPLAEIMGALPHEVVAMNSLTVNLHLMMVSFYRPTPERFRIVIEKQAFPSDRYAVESQIRHHGFDPDQALVELEDQPGNAQVSNDTLAAYLDQHGDSVALVLMPGVQYFSGQLQDLDEVTRLAHACGARAGFDLAHAAGNLPLNLHDSACDFAVWCSYKYLNSGPGAVAGCFVHERWADRSDLNRFAGWWGHQPETRFLMGPDFVPARGADGWQLSNPPIMALAPVRVSLPIFVEAGMANLRKKSIRLTGYLDWLLRKRLESRVTILTPADPDRRGCQLSLQLSAGARLGKRTHERLEQAGVICDWREPDVIRIAPTPLYNSFGDVFRFVDVLEETLTRTLNEP
jgi:kynureninase